MGQIVVVYIYHLFTTDVSKWTNGNGLDNILQCLQSVKKDEKNASI